MKRDRILRNLRLFNKQRSLHLMVIPGVVFVLVFSYIPMVGVITAFQDYNISKGVFDSPFVGLKHFNEAFGDMFFKQSFNNSLGMSITKLLMTFFPPIIFALILNELRTGITKKLIQTFSYLPHFISWVVAAALFQMWLDPKGLINILLVSSGIIKQPIRFLQESGRFWVLMGTLDVWKETGWWSIIFFSAITAIPQEMYEAAIVDGAGRLDRMLRITLPSIRSTISIVFILSMGSLFSGGMSGSNMNQSLLLSNALNRKSSLILDTYVIELGLKIGRYSFATAVGLVLSVLSCILFVSSNSLVKKLGGGDNSLY